MNHIKYNIYQPAAAGENRTLWEGRAKALQKHSRTIQNNNNYNSNIHKSVGNRSVLG